MRRCILNLIREFATEPPRTFSKAERNENQPIMHKRVKLNIESMNTPKKKNNNETENRMMNDFK